MAMKQWAQKQTGFTIVELLIVIVVIAILAAITIVAYNGIRDQATASSVQSGLSQANKKVLAYAVRNADTYPTTLADAGVQDTDSVSYQYTSDTAAREYAITASNGPVGAISFYLSNTKSTPTSGIAPGHNIMVWDKSDNSTAPVVNSSGVAVDTSVFRTSSSSLRMSTGTTGRSLRVNPVEGEVGQVITVSLWIRTDSNWNGSGNNSKIRFGGISDGSLLAACGYSGVKTTWTFVTCSRTLTAAYPGANITVGNDGSVGNIWLDDISVSIK